MLSTLGGVLSLGVGYVVGCIFLNAGLSKLMPANQTYYQSVITGYKITPESWSKKMVLVIGMTELLTALLVVLTSTSGMGLILAAAIFGFYTLIFAKQILQGKADIDCGCAGPGAGVQISINWVYRNVALIVLSIGASFGLAIVPLEPYLMAIPVALVLGLTYLSVEQITLNSQKIQAIRQSGL